MKGFGFMKKKPIVFISYPIIPNCKQVHFKQSEVSKYSIYVIWQHMTVQKCFKPYNFL